MRIRRFLLGGGVLVVLSSATTLAFASQRIAAEQAAYRAPAVGRCDAGTLNRSAVLPGTGARRLAAARLLRRLAADADQPAGGAPRALSPTCSVSGSQSGSHPGRLIGYSQGDGASFVPSKPFVARARR